MAQTELRLDPGNTPQRLLDKDRDAQQLCHELIASEITAIIAENAMIALTLQRTVRKLGIQIPQQLSLISLGGAQSDGKSGRLATMLVPRREMGRKAVELLLRLLDEPAAAPLQCRLPCDLKLTGTVGPPAR